MNVAINARWLIANKLEGFGWYTYHLVKEMAVLHPEWNFLLLYDRKPENWLIDGLNIRNRVLVPQARSPLLWTVFNQIAVPQALRSIKPDVYFSPDGFLPNRSKVPMAATIHDLNFESEESFLPEKVKKYYQKHFRKSAAKAKHIFTISDFSRNDIVARYNVAPEKISFVHNGPQYPFKAITRETQATRQQYAGTHPYFLFVGAQNPRKNLHRIFKAFDDFCTSFADRYHLVIVGERMHWNEQINQAWEEMRHKNLVNFTGRLSSEALNKVYSAATALLFPSLFEGFGMPIIEAFMAGTPVVTANCTAMPEVAANAALLVDPEKPIAITNAMLRIVEEEGLTKSLREKGTLRAQDFSWKIAAVHVAEKLKELAHA